MSVLKFLKESWKICFQTEQMQTCSVVMKAGGDIHVLALLLVLQNMYFGSNTGADPGGARAPPLTLGFEAPKLSIFGPYLIFP